MVDHMPIKYSFLHNLLCKRVSWKSDYNSIHLLILKLCSVINIYVLFTTLKEQCISFFFNNESDINILRLLSEHLHNYYLICSLFPYRRERGKYYYLFFRVREFEMQKRWTYQRFCNLAKLLKWIVF